MFGERVWPFVREVPDGYGELLRRRERLVRPMATVDAGIGIDLINPWQPA